MSIFRNANESAYVGGRKHFTDVIKNSGSGNLLVWRQPEEDFNTNSTLVVMPGEQAVFVNEGTVEEVFDSGTYKLSTQNYPFISRLRNMLSGGVSTFNCVVYFVRTTTTVEIRWGTDTPLQVRDKLLGIATEVRAHGSYRACVTDAAHFLQSCVGNNVVAVTPDDVVRTFGMQFQSTVKALLTERLNNLDTELLGVEARLGEFSQQVAPYVADALEEYGLGLVAFNIAALNIADDELRRRYDQIGMDNIEKIRGAQGDKAVLGILGDDWGRLTSADIMKTFAANPGSGGGAADLAGIALGMAAAEPFAAMAQRIMGPGAAAAAAAAGSAGAAAAGGAGDAGSPADAGAAPSAGATSAAGAATDDPVATLAQLKKMLDLGLIERDDYDAKKAEVLGRM